MVNEGLVHIYTGDGKGKTTAAIGLATRAAGAGMSVLFSQFVKGQESSEISSLKKLNIKIIRDDSVKKFVYYMNENEKAQYKAVQKSLLASIISIQNQFDVIVCDELLDAIDTGMIEKSDVINFILGKPKNTELIITGHVNYEEIDALAGYITAMQCVRHPYNSGVQARIGIEY